MSTANLLPGVPHMESPLFEKIFAEKNVSPETLQIARALRRDGFAVLDFPDPDFNQLAAKIIKSLDRQDDWDGWRKGKVPNLRIQDEYATPGKHTIRPKLPPDFDAAAYLRANPDVAAAKVNPAEHWINFGYSENRPLR